MRDETSKRGYIGYCIDLIDTIAELSHFDYIITEENDHGYMDDDGIWNGVIRKLIDKEADIGLGIIFIFFLSSFFFFFHFFARIENVRHYIGTKTFLG